MQLSKWICTICEWVYDEEAEGVPFNDLPDDWVCPSCGVDKSLFEEESD
jgi:rubredoxin